MRARFAEIEKRSTPLKKNIYYNGEDNLYPNTVDALISNSVTASQCAEKMSAFLVGKGFGDAVDNIIVNAEKDYTAYDFLTLKAGEISRHKGVFIHVNYDLEGKPSYDVLQYEKCRVSKEDDRDNRGKIYYQDYSQRYVKERWFYPYNPDLKVINAQRNKDCEILKIKEPTLAQLIENYRGQVYFLTFDNSRVYPLAWIHAVRNDCESEYHISLMRNKQIKNGFQKSTVFLTNEMEKEEGDEMFDAIKKLSGSENAGNVAMIELKNFNKESFHIEQLESNIDDKIVDLTEQRLANNIRKVYRIPKELVDSEKGAMFGSSGEAMKELIDFYSDELSKERKILEQVCTMLLKPFLPTETKLKIIPINQTEGENPDVGSEEDRLNRESQAELKGSVGGVQAVLSIQQSVSQETTDYSSGVAILQAIFGYSEEVAKKILGTPKIQEDAAISQ